MSQAIAVDRGLPNFPSDSFMSVPIEYVALPGMGRAQDLVLRVLEEAIHRGVSSICFVRSASLELRFGDTDGELRDHLPLRMADELLKYISEITDPASGQRLERGGVLYALSHERNGNATKVTLIQST